jgi:proteasome assembly chaperone (PAC2) family protein
MSFAHIIYIPGSILLGMVIGYVMGTRAAMAEAARLKAKRKE